MPLLVLANKQDMAGVLTAEQVSLHSNTQDKSQDKYKHARVTAGAVWADAGHSDGPRLERGGDLGQDGGRRPARPQLAHQQHVTSLSRGAASGEMGREI